MDILGSIVACLSKKEVDELLHSLHVNKSTKCKEAELLKAIRQHPDGKPQELAAKIYKPLNLVAYNATRKRLAQKSLHYIGAQRLTTEYHSPDAAVGLVLAARWLIDRNQPAAARALLNRAEEEALASRRYALLENIYLIFIDHAGLLKIAAADVSKRWEANARAYDTFRKIKRAEAIVHDELEVVRQGHCPPEPETIVEPVLKSIHVSAEEANNPHLQLALVSIVRRAYASVKRYDVIEAFVRRTYDQLEAAGSFTAMTADVQTKFLYMQAHARYRTRNFNGCRAVLDELRALINRQTGKRHPFVGRAVLLEAALLSYTGENARAIDLLTAAVDDPEALIDDRDLLNMRLNLAVYHFNAGSFRTARMFLSQTALSDARIDKLMGKEWRFKRGMIELIVQYELGEEELALAMIRRLQEGFATYLAHPAYVQAGSFLDFIKRLIQNPQEVSTELFREQIKATAMVVGPARVDLQGQAFFAWLHSKMVSRPYYELLVERLNQHADLKP